MNLKSVTVFFPACNDGGTIGSQVITALPTITKCLWSTMAAGIIRQTCWQNYRAGIRRCECCITTATGATVPRCEPVLRRLEKNGCFIPTVMRNTIRTI